MCDLTTLTKIFLLGGYCFQHFHKSTTTVVPTTVPTTLDVCVPCASGPMVSLPFTEDLKKALCKGSLRIPLSTLMSDPCLDLLVLHLSMPTCTMEMESLEVTQVDFQLEYLGSTGHVEYFINVNANLIKLALCSNQTLLAPLPIISVVLETGEPDPIQNINIIVSEVSCLTDVCCETCRESGEIDFADASEILCFLDPFPLIQFFECEGIALRFDMTDCVTQTEESTSLPLIVSTRVIFYYLYSRGQATVTASPQFLPIDGQKCLRPFPQVASLSLNNPQVALTFTASAGCYLSTLLLDLSVTCPN